MRKLKRQILNILAWIALAVGIIMIIWKMFGSSPSYIEILVPFVVMSIFKIWAVNNEFKDFKYHTKLSFTKIREDTKRIENKIDNLKR